MPEQLKSVPDLDELQAIEQQLDAAGEFLDKLEQLLGQLDALSNHHAQIKSVTQAFAKGDVSVVTQYFSVDQSPVIQQLTNFADQTETELDNLQTRITSTLELVNEPINDFKSKLEDIHNYIEMIGGVAETLNEIVETILINKTDMIREASDALTQLRQDKLNEGSSWVDEQVGKIVEELIDKLLGDITARFEDYAQQYIGTIDDADQHVGYINQYIENSVGKVADQLDKVADILRAAKPVIDTAEIILA